MYSIVTFIYSMPLCLLHAFMPVIYAFILGKNHDQDELHPGDRLHCPDCFL